MEQDTVAECEMECVWPDGATRTVRLRVGRPYQPDVADWCCMVAADGLGGRPLRPVWGVDSWQALQLALRLLAEIVQIAADRGVTFHWPNGDTRATTAAELFGYCPLRP